jgi:tripartite-type tricarboxylate transporter receptor subunit TctC
MMFAQVSTAKPLIDSGELRALGVASARRSAALPDVPTIAESGLPGFEVVVWYAVFVAGTPPPEVIARLTAASSRAVSSPEVQKKLADAGVDPGASSPADLAARVRAEMAKWSKVVKDARLPVQ